MARFSDRLKHAWNAFTNQLEPQADLGFVASYGSRPDRQRRRGSNERSIVSSVYNRIAIDFAQCNIRHVRLDQDDRYIEDMVSGLNNCLMLEANVDQGARALRQDIALTLFDEGVIAIVPVDTTIDPTQSGAFDVKTLRVGSIVGWYPYHIKVRLYNEAKGVRDDIVLEKKFVAIVENPLYSVMNEPSSTLQRLIRKLNMLDAVDEQSSSGKLDLIVQLPYTIKSEARRQQAEQRRTDIEFQLKGSQYGIAYTDGTEKITQLNRPAENNLLTQVQYLTDMLYSQLGITPEVMNGTANEATMLNYMNRTIAPLLDAVVESMQRTFLTKTARSQQQSIMWFHDPFKLVPISSIAEIADKLVRNEVVTKNELRGILGFKPIKGQGADKLSNPNMPVPPTPVPPHQVPPDPNQMMKNDPTQQTATPSSLNGKGNSQNGT